MLFAFTTMTQSTDTCLIRASTENDYSTTKIDYQVNKMTDEMENVNDFYNILKSYGTVHFSFEYTVYGSPYAFDIIINDVTYSYGFPSSNDMGINDMITISPNAESYIDFARMVYIFYVTFVQNY